VHHIGSGLGSKSESADSGCGSGSYKMIRTRQDDRIRIQETGTFFYLSAFTSLGAELGKVNFVSVKALEH
jgi:hypothetical protein